MKFLLLILLAVPCAAQQTQPVVQGNDIAIVNNDNYPKIQLRQTALANQTNPWFWIGTQTNTVFQIPASGIIAAQYLGITSNSVLPITSGGTGGSNALSARVGLGINELATNNSTQLKTALGLNGGLTTNFNVIFGSALTNTLKFSNGVLTNIVAVP